MKVTKKLFNLTTDRKKRNFLVDTIFTQFKNLFRQGYSICGNNYNRLLDFLF